MRKKSTRLLSAALAACMMLSVLPVGAFAAEPGTEPENGNGVSAQAEETLPFAGKEITEGGTYTMDGGEYTGPITVNVQDGSDVIIKITGHVTTSIKDVLIEVVNGQVKINGDGATVENIREGLGSYHGIGSALIALSSTDNNTTVEINGGISGFLNKFGTEGFDALALQRMTGRSAGGLIEEEAEHHAARAGHSCGLCAVQDKRLLDLIDALPPQAFRAPDPAGA